MSPDKLLDDLAESATCARAHYQVWWALANRIYPDLEDRANDYADFFRASFDAHYTAMFINVGHLFDRRQDSSSVKTLLDLLVNDLTEDEHASFTTRFEALAARATPVVTARHKTVAHIDALLTEKEVFQPLEITWNEVRDLIDDTCRLVRDLVRKRGLSHAIFESQRYLDATLDVVRSLPPKGA